MVFRNWFNTDRVIYSYQITTIKEKFITSLLFVLMSSIDLCMACIFVEFNYSTDMLFKLFSHFLNNLDFRNIRTKTIETVILITPPK